MMDQRRMTTLSPGARMACRIVGISLIVVGLAGFIFAPISMVSGMADFMDGGSPFIGMRSFLLFGFGGVLCIGLGAFLTKLGFLRMAADIVSTETAGAVEHSSGALGRGLGKGLHQSGTLSRGRDIVKIKCRRCGFLESEDAKFCSDCGKAI